MSRERHAGSGGAGLLKVCRTSESSGLEILNCAMTDIPAVQLDHIIEIRTERSEYALDLLHHLPSLADNIVHQHDVASIIDGRLSTDKDHFTASHPLHERSR